jgi:hypothetical protein
MLFESASLIIIIINKYFYLPILQTKKDYNISILTQFHSIIDSTIFTVEKLFFTLIALVFTLSALAQTSVVRGKVIDANNQPVNSTNWKRG